MPLVNFRPDQGNIRVAELIAQLMGQYNTNKQRADIDKLKKLGLDDKWEKRREQTATLQGIVDEYKNEFREPIYGTKPAGQLTDPTVQQQLSALTTPGPPPPPNLREVQIPDKANILGYKPKSNVNREEVINRYRQKIELANKMYPSGWAADYREILGLPVEKPQKQFRPPNTKEFTVTLEDGSIKTISAATAQGARNIAKKYGKVKKIDKYISDKERVTTQLAKAKQLKEDEQRHFDFGELDFDEQNNQLWVLEDIAKRYGAKIKKVGEDKWYSDSRKYILSKDGKEIKQGELGKVTQNKKPIKKLKPTPTALAERLVKKYGNHEQAIDELKRLGYDPSNIK